VEKQQKRGKAVPGTVAIRRIFAHAKFALRRQNKVHIFKTQKLGRSDYIK
jgi:hypothetical protein